ncbi:MAG: YkgJ family cysteine cluster protein [Planctomycetaceae bacterium]
MAAEEFLCVRCARYMKTCCQTCDIYATPGDVERIAEYTGTSGFTEFRTPDDPRYLDQDDDPVWRDHVFRGDGSRRVLKRQATGDCTFLGENGCRLPLEIRPLICRLYPFDYDADDLRDGLSEGCPVELLRPGQGLLQALEMNSADARRWHQQLYQEIRRETGEHTCTSA